MTADQEVIDALSIPAEARVDQRVPKKLLAEQGAPTAADRRHIQVGIEELRWFAALKPSNIGVSEYRDTVRQYLEIAVLGVTLRPQGKALRLTELIHRAIPYPALLLTAQGAKISLSLAHIRCSQSEPGQTVIDGLMIHSPPLCAHQAGSLDAPSAAFLGSLSMSAQPRAHLHALYQGWIECVEAFQAARLSGRFRLAPTPQAADARRTALVEYDRTTREIKSLRARAEKEPQISRRVDLNLDIRRLEAELAKAAQNL